MSSSILIVGSGAMASLFAARLAVSSVDVTMLGSWPAGLRALRERGVRVVDPDGLERAYPVRVTDDPRSCVGTKYALVLVKSWQTERAARQLEICLSPGGLALTLQNGLDNCQKLEEVLGAERVALGVTTTGATLLEPGRVRPVGVEAVSLSDHPRLKPLSDLLQRAGFSVEMVADASSLLWGKLVINAAINPLTALLRVPNGELLNRPTAHTLLGIVAQEAAAVAQEYGVRLPYSDPVAVAETVAQRTATNTSSMLCDVLRGSLTEIDAISGAIVRVGEQKNVPTPVNRTLWQLVKALENENRNHLRGTARGANAAV